MTTNQEYALVFICCELQAFNTEDIQDFAAFFSKAGGVSDGRREEGREGMSD